MRKIKYYVTLLLSFINCGFSTELPFNNITARDIVKSYNLNIDPLVNIRCAMDVARDLVFSKYDESNSSYWKVLAADFCCEYWFNEICSAVRKKMFLSSKSLDEDLKIVDLINDESSNHFMDLVNIVSERKIVNFVVIPIIIVSSLFAANKILGLFDVLPQYTWFIVNQLFQAFLFSKSILEQGMDLASVFHSASTESKVSKLDYLRKTIVKICHRINPMIAHVLIYFRFGDYSDTVDDSLKILASSSNSSNWVQLVNIGGLFLAFKMMKNLIMLKTFPFALLGVKMFEKYVNEEFWKMFYTATGQIKGELRPVRTADLDGGDEKTLADFIRYFLEENPLVMRILYGTIGAKMATSLFGVNQTFVQTAMQTAMLLAIWQHNRDMHTQVLEKRIVGYNMRDLSQYYSLIRNFVPMLPNIGSYLEDAQNLVFTLAYPLTSINGPTDALAQTGPKAP
ncbi:MAG: hypothetical protein LBF72_01670 [Holosporales bacterium]|jgi:hypothetical protein|nr:hypothetical protein [Holosporales bacterium]